MRLRSFLGLVEIRTKAASIIPFALGTLYAVYHFERFDVRNFIILCISLLCFDMVTTALNNYFDFKRAYKTHGYNYETHNSIVRDDMDEAAVLRVIAALLSVAVLAGLLLVYYTDIVVLGIGMVSFLAGICYSFGPVPISRTPLGEVVSGLFMGFVIVFVSAYVHIQDLGLVALQYRDGLLAIQVQVTEAAAMFLVSLPAVAGIANIMLANNICDIEDDQANRRYTLPIYIGKRKALLLFAGLYYTAFASVLLLAALRLIPWICLLSLLILVRVHKNIRSFYDLQTKKDTFALAVKNFLLLCGSYTALLGAGTLLKYLL